MKLAALLVFALLGAFGPLTAVAAETLPAYAVRWAAENAKLADSLDLDADERDLQNQVLKFYLEFLVARESGKDVQDLGGDFIDKRARELKNLQRTILMYWDDAPLREQQVFELHYLDVERDIAAAAEELRTAKTLRQRAGAENLLQNLRAKLVELRFKIEQSREPLAKNWKAARSLLESMHQTLTWNLKSGVTYQDLFTQQFLTALLLEVSGNHFYLAPASLHVGTAGAAGDLVEAGDFGWAYEFDIRDNYENLEMAMDMWRARGTRVAIPIIADHMREIRREARAGHLVVPLMKSTDPSFDLSTGYLPISYLRFNLPSLKIGDIVYPSTTSFNSDLMNLGTEISKYDFQPLRMLEPSLKYVDGSLNTWMRLIPSKQKDDGLVNSEASGAKIFSFVQRRKKSPEVLRNEGLALAYLHMARFGALLKDDFAPIPWWNPTRVARSFAQDFLFQSDRRWKPQRRFFNVNLIDDLHRHGVHRYESLVDDLKPEAFYPDEIAKGLDLLVARLAGDSRFDANALGRLSEHDLFTRVPARVVSTRLTLLRDRYDYRAALTDENDTEDCEDSLHNSSQD